MQPENGFGWPCTAETKKKERLPFWQAFLKESTLDGTGNLAGAEAPSTYVDMAGSTVDQSLYATNVRLPGSVRTSVGVGNLDTKGNALAANIALCHFPAPPSFGHCIADIILPHV